MATFPYWAVAALFPALRRLQEPIRYNRRWKGGCERGVNIMMFNRGVVGVSDKGCASQTIGKLKNEGRILSLHKQPTSRSGSPDSESVSPSMAEPIVGSTSRGSVE